MTFWKYNCKSCNSWTPIWRIPEAYTVYAHVYDLLYKLCAAFPLGAIIIPRETWISIDDCKPPIYTFRRSKWMLKSATICLLRWPNEIVAALFFIKLLTQSTWADTKTLSSKATWNHGKLRKIYWPCGKHHINHRNMQTIPTGKRMEIKLRQSDKWWQMINLQSLIPLVPLIDLIIFEISAGNSYLKHQTSRGWQLGWRCPWPRNSARASPGYHGGYSVYLGFGEDGLVHGSFTNTPDMDLGALCCLKPHHCRLFDLEAVRWHVPLQRQLQRFCRGRAEARQPLECDFLFDSFAKIKSHAFPSSLRWHPQPGGSCLARV